MILKVRKDSWCLSSVILLRSDLLRNNKRLICLLLLHCQVRSDDVKVLKSRWNFVKTKTTTPGNNIYTLLITFIAFTSFISSKFQTLFFPYKLSYCAWATCGNTALQINIAHLDRSRCWQHLQEETKNCLIHGELTEENKALCFFSERWVI